MAPRNSKDDAATLAMFDSEVARLTGLAHETTVSHRRPARFDVAATRGLLAKLPAVLRDQQLRRDVDGMLTWADEANAGRADVFEAARGIETFGSNLRRGLKRLL